MIKLNSDMYCDNYSFVSSGIDYALCQFPLNIRRVECDRSLDSDHQDIEVYFYCNDCVTDVIISEDIYDYAVLRELHLI